MRMASIANENVAMPGMRLTDIWNEKDEDKEQGHDVVGQIHDSTGHRLSDRVCTLHRQLKVERDGTIEKEALDDACRIQTH